MGERIMMRLYISGGMSGHPEHNFPAFYTAATRMRQLGYRVHNPATKGIIDGWTWAQYMRYDIEKLMKCDGILMLNGWRRSKGANLEYYIAKALGFTILFERDL